MAKITKKDALKFLAAVPEDKVFWCHDSCVMHDMKELAQALNDMTDEIFAFHANETKNDFSDWVQDVIGDRVLADSLRRALTRAEAAKVVATRVAFLSSKAA